MSEDDIVVLAGTGKTGRRVAAALRVAGYRPRVASRRGPVPFEWDDEDTWAWVTRGVRAMWLVVPDDPEPIGRFVARAADDGAARMVLLSARGVGEADGFFAGMAAAEQELRRVPGSTVLRAATFAQNFTEDLFAEPLRAGRLALPVGGAPEPFVDLADVAAVGARILVDGGHDGQVLELTGPDEISYPQAVGMIARASGRDLRYESQSPDDYAAELRAGGIAEAGVAELRGVFGFIAAGGTGGVSGDVEKVLGRPARPFATWVAEQAAAGAWTAGQPT